MLLHLPYYMGKCFNQDDSPGLSGVTVGADLIPINKSNFKIKSVSKSNTMYKKIFVIALFAMWSVKIFSQTPPVTTGQTLFTANCTSCHTIGKGKLVGPDLKDIHKKRSEAWLLQWTKSSSSFIKSGDADAVAVFNENNKIPMTDFNFLSDEQIKSIIGYIQTESENTQIVSISNAQVNTSSDRIQETNQSSSGISFGEYILIGVLVICLLIIWWLYRIIKRLADDLADLYEMKKRFS